MANYDECTPASIQAAREDCARQRRELGLNPDPDAPAFVVPALCVLRELPPSAWTLRTPDEASNVRH